MNGQLGMDLPSFIALVRSRIRLIAGVVAAAVLLAIVASLLQPDRYRATAHLLFGPSPAASALGTDLGDTGADLPERVAATNLALASLDGVAARVKRQLGTAAPAEDLQAAVEVRTTGDSDIGTVTAEWDSPAGAADVANAFATQIVEMRAEAARADIRRATEALEAVLAAQPPGAPPASTRALRDRISTLQALAAVDSGGVRVVEPAAAPRERSSPRPLRNAVIAGFVALVLALLLVAVLARVDERVSDEEELAALVRAPVLGAVPALPRQRTSSVAAAVDDEAALADAFEFLRLNLQLRRPAGDGGVAYAITSTRSGEGKTLVAGRLASALGAAGADVVLVDHDVRKPELAGQFDPFAEPADSAPAPPRERAGRPDKIERGLTELAVCDGNARQAARALWADGLHVSESTLRRWKSSHPERYDEIRAEVAGSATAYAPQPTLEERVQLLTVADVPALASMPSDRERLRGLFARLKASADYVLIDTVPVTAAPEASAAAAEADGVLLVVDLARLRRRDLTATLRQLANARAEIVGIVLNRAAGAHAGYPPHPNGGGLARQLADGSRATLRRVQKGPTARLAALIRRDGPRDR